MQVYTRCSFGWNEGGQLKFALHFRFSVHVFSLGFCSGFRGKQSTNLGSTWLDRTSTIFDGRSSLKLPPFQDVELLVSGRIPLPGEIIEIFWPGVFDRLFAEEVPRKRG